MTARFIKDIERCPYVPSQPEYDEWCRKDDERTKKLEEEYQELKEIANQNLSNSDSEIRQMAHFVLDMIRD